MGVTGVIQLIQAISFVLISVVCFQTKHITDFVKDATRGPYVAVFLNPGFEQEWNGVKPDLLFTAYEWGSFDQFLHIIKQQAGKRPIQIDIDCHGGRNGVYLQYRSKTNEGNMEFASDQATMGYIVNHIADVFKKQKPILCLEICRSGSAYKNTIRDNDLSTFDAKADVENCLTVPEFPIYAIGGDGPNIGNQVYLRFLHNMPLTDLRIYETAPCPEVTKAEYAQMAGELALVWYVLLSYGT